MLYTYPSGGSLRPRVAQVPPKRILLPGDEETVTEFVNCVHARVRILVVFMHLIFISVVAMTLHHISSFSVPACYTGVRHMT